MKKHLWIALAVAACVPTSMAGAEEVLRIGVIGQLAGFHPNMAGANSGMALAARGLTYFDGSVSMACLLCETLPTVANGGVTDDITPDGAIGQRVIFKLKPSLKWDDGEPVIADDVVLSWKAGRQAESGYSWRSRLTEEIWSVAALDSRTIEVRRRGRSCLPSDFRFLPLPSRIEKVAAEGDRYADDTLYARAPATPGLYNGPYRVAAFGTQGGQKVVLKPNPHWAGPKPAYDRIELVYRATGAAMTEAMVAAEVDLMTDVSAAMAAEVSRRAPGRFSTILRPGRSTMQVTLNLEDSRLADRRVRQALLLALNRPALAASVQGAVAAKSFLTSRFPYYDDGIEDRPGQIGEAAKLLDQAGWTVGSDGVRRNSEGARLAFRFAVSSTAAAQPFTGMITDSWRKIGVQVMTEPFTGIGQLTAKNPPPMALFGYTLEGGQNIDFHIFSSSSIPKEGEARNGLNVFRYRNADVDKVVEQLRDGCSAEELAPAYHSLQRRVAEDLPFLPLFFIPEIHLLPPDLVLPAEDRIQFLQTAEVETWQRR